MKLFGQQRACHAGASPSTPACNIAPAASHTGRGGASECCTCIVGMQVSVICVIRFTDDVSLSQ